MAPSLFKEHAMVLVHPNEPELLLIEGDDPVIRLHFPRVREIAHRDVYAGFGPDEIVPFPGRMDEEAHVPLCACHVRQLALSTEALAQFFHAHGNRVERDDYETRESRIVRGHAMELEFPCFTTDYQWLEDQEPVRRDPMRVGRNDPCPCGSGKKFKRCHLLQRTN